MQIGPILGSLEPQGLEIYSPQLLPSDLGTPLGIGGVGMLRGRLSSYGDLEPGPGEHTQTDYEALVGAFRGLFGHMRVPRGSKYPYSIYIAPKVGT